MEERPTNAEPTKRKRRWYQFSLRTLMIAVTLFSISTAWVGSQVKIVRDRRAIFDDLDRSLPNAYAIRLGSRHVNPVRRWLGDLTIESVSFISFATHEEVERARLAFPEASIVLAIDDSANKAPN